MMNLFFAAVAGFAFAANSPLKLRYFQNESYKQVVTEKVGQFRVDEKCAKSSSCKSLQIAKGGPYKIHKTKASFIGNPAANYCWDVGAKNRVLKDEKNNQYDYCVFEDGSIIDAWTLYSSHFPREKIK